jgi:hypothetical protein
VTNAKDYHLSPTPLTGTPLTDSFNLLGVALVEDDGPHRAGVGGILGLELEGAGAALDERDLAGRIVKQQNQNSKAHQSLGLTAAYGRTAEAGTLHFANEVLFYRLAAGLFPGVNRMENTITG